MRTPDGYRFGLQFKRSSDAHRQVGELLESLGNKKSEVIVTAMVEYIKAHPEVLNNDNPVKIIAAYGYSEDTLLAKIKELICQVADAGAESSNNPTNAWPNNVAENALDTLLNALDRFE